MPVAAALDLKIGSKDAVTAAKRLKRMGDAARDTGAQIRDANGRFISHGQQVKGLVGLYDTLGVKVNGLVAGFAAFAIVKKAIGVIAEFSETIQTLGAVTGARTKDLEVFEKQARKLGATTRFTAKQAAEGQLALARAGFTQEEVLSATSHALALASIAQLELGRAAEITAITLRQFGLEGVEAARVTDILVTTANNSATTVEQLAQGLKFAGTIAHGFGISLDETAAALGVLASAGLQATQGGTALRGVLAALSGPSAQAAETMETLAKVSGQSVSAFDITKHSIEEVFEAFKKANAGPKEFLAIFGRLQAPGALALTASAAEIGKLEEANLNVKETAQELADFINDTLKGDLLALAAAFDELFLATDDGVGPALRDIVKVSTEVVRMLAGMEAGAEGFSFAAHAVVFVLKAILASAIIFVGIKLAVAIWASVTAIRAATFSLKAFRVALASTGIGLLAVLLGVATTAAIEFFGVFEDGSKELEDGSKARDAALRKEVETARIAKAKVQAAINAETAAKIAQVNELDDANKKAEKVKADAAKAGARSREAAEKAEERARNAAGEKIEAINRELDRRKFLAQFEAGEARKREAEIASLIDLGKRELGLKPGDAVPDSVTGELQDLAQSYRDVVSDVEAAEERTRAAVAANTGFEDLEAAANDAGRAIADVGRSAESQIKADTFAEFNEAFKDITANARISAQEMVDDGATIEEAWESASGSLTRFQEGVAALAEQRALVPLIADAMQARDAFVELSKSQDLSPEGLSAMEAAAESLTDKYSEGIARGVKNSDDLRSAIDEVNAEVERFRKNTEQAEALRTFEDLTKTVTNSYIDFVKAVVTGSEDASVAIKKLLAAIAEAAFQKLVVDQIIGAVGKAFDGAVSELGGGGSVDSLPDVNASVGGGAPAFRSGLAVDTPTSGIASAATPVSTRSPTDRGSLSTSNVVHLTQNIQTRDADSFSRSQRQIGSRATEGSSVSRRTTRRAAL